MRIVVSFNTIPGQRQLLEQFFKTKAEIVFVEDYPAEMKNNLISGGDILLTWNWSVI